MVYVLIVAGGKGARFSSHKPKQYEPLAGIPILIHTLRAFDACEVVDSMVLVVPGADIRFVRDSMVPAAGLQKTVRTIAGGPRRQESVYNGLRRIEGGDETVVVIHDAVRPLVTGKCVFRCVEAARQHGACITALPAWDTLKRATPSGTIETTLPRERVWLAQTPQAFRMNLIRAAHVKARKQRHLGTDDASLVERMGVAVHILPGSRCNIKITTVQDLAFAEFLLQARQKADWRLLKGTDGC
jgi:2-C-methyl-D-erythritol 4-phosphate cytidylyltransferase